MSHNSKETSKNRHRKDVPLYNHLVSNCYPPQETEVEENTNERLFVTPVSVHESVEPQQLADNFPDA